MSVGLESPDGKRFAKWSPCACINLEPHEEDGGEACDYGPMWFLIERRENGTLVFHRRCATEREARRFVDGTED